MRLLTLNLHCRQEVMWEKNLGILADYIHENNVDVVALQECAQPLGNEELSDDNDLKILHSLLLQRGVSFEVCWTLNHVGFESHFEGLGILSRYPISSIRSFVISESIEITDWQTRKAQLVELIVNGSRVELCNLHLGIQDRALGELQNLCQQAHLENAIVVGDFNISDDEATYDKVAALLKKPDVYRALIGRSDPTFFVGADGWGGAEGKRIDYVFAHEGKAIKRAFTGMDSPRISDHMGLLVDFPF